MTDHSLSSSLLSKSTHCSLISHLRANGKRGTKKEKEGGVRMSGTQTHFWMVRRKVGIGQRARVKSSQKMRDTVMLETKWTE